MFGVIYKITNILNNKVYIGQTIRPLEERIERHFDEAENNVLPENHFHRAIRKYGRENFKVEKIDEAENREELNNKEKFWIKEYKSTNDELGYNSTAGGEGGNTYLKRTKEQMEETKRKISIANSGRGNGMSKQIKCKSIKTGEEHFFGSAAECCRFFGTKNKEIFIDRANGENNTYWRDEWMFAFEKDDYRDNYFIKPPRKCRNGTKTYLISEKETLEFDSKNEAIHFLGYSTLKSGALLENAIINGYTVKFSL